MRPDPYQSRIRFCLSGFLCATLCALLTCSPTGTDDDDDDSGDDNPVTLQPDDFESNDTWQDAALLGLDTATEATLHENADVDYYRITTDHGSNTYDRVQYSLTTTDADLILHLELVDTLGRQLLQVTADNAGQNLVYTVACPGGVYIVRVSGWDHVMHRDNGSDGPYEIEVSNMNANDSLAPNHTLDMAAEVDFGESYDGVLVSKYEDDWYHLTNQTADQWDLFTVQLTNVSSDLARAIDIFNEFQEEIYVTTGAALVIDEGSDLTYTFASKSAGFYVSVYGWDNIMHDPNGSSGSYTIQITDNNANDSNEPDDTFADARVIDAVPASALEGTIITDAANDNGGDFEFFKVSIADSTRIGWSADPSAANTELHFRVYDDSEAYLGNEDGGDGETITGSLSNTSGSDTFFYISLGGFVGDNGDYTITFTESAVQ